MNGIIIGVHDGGQAGGFGHIAPDMLARPRKLFFRAAAVADDGFAQLRAGQRVRFDQEPLPGDASRRQAVNVVPLD